MNLAQNMKMDRPQLAGRRAVQVNSLEETKMSKSDSTGTPAAAETAGQPVVLMLPCLPGCDRADQRAADLANPRIEYHVCGVLIGELPANGRVEVCAGVGADGSTEAVMVAVVDGPEPDQMTPADAAALAGLLAKAAEFAQAVTR
ncbi:hypothetical protein [Amycolatopsis magusensis]|uniref:hypothetical protein n=1 Tax=Amycolatopsis magusensis TaxID=882444 RepID=UPI003C2B1717